MQRIHLRNFRTLAERIKEPCERAANSRCDALELLAGDQVLSYLYREEKTLATKQFLLALDGDDAVLKTVSRVAAPYYQALVTRDPRKFLAWLENTQNIAVVVTEHVLQTASGVALLESARTMRPSARRVLLTTYHDLASIVDGLHSGAIEKMVQKPFTQADLLFAILPETAAGEMSQRVSA